MTTTVETEYRTEAEVMRHYRLNRDQLGRAIAARQFPRPDLVISRKRQLWKTSTLAVWERQQAAK